MRDVLGLAFCVSLCLGVVCASAQSDVPGAKDHPLISRYPGSTIIDYHEKNFEGVDVPTGPVITKDGKYQWKGSERAEGQYTRIRYRGPAGRNALEVFRNFQAALTKAGLKTLYTCDLAACDNLSFHKFTAADGVVSGNRAQEHFVAAKGSSGDGTVYVQVYVTENHNWPPEGQPAGRRVDKGLAVIQLEVSEVKSMDAGLVTVDAGAMKKTIVETGRVALYGLFFDTGKADIRPESRPALDEIAKLMKGDPALRLLVVGHTDTVGSQQGNQDLSLRRAQAVIDALVKGHGIDAKRLQAAGVGFASPVATNRTEQGRAKNRRVELVEY
jgi:outer membrane protein OmpA-like peptidoglycan-associated protein